jgi:hypothetical protein
MAMEFPRLSDADKSALAEFALDVGLHSAAADNQSKSLARDLRFQAAKALTGRRWSKASPLAIEHFDAVLQEYERGLADRRFLVEAINLLGEWAATRRGAADPVPGAAQRLHERAGVRQHDRAGGHREPGQAGRQVAFDDPVRGIPQVLFAGGACAAQVRAKLKVSAGPAPALPATT